LRLGLEKGGSDESRISVHADCRFSQNLALPFDQFAFAELKSERKEQQFRPVFAKIELILRVHSL
jgi:hypothetical protein